MKSVSRILAAASFAACMIAPAVSAQDTVEEGATNKQFPKTVSFQYDYKTYTLEVTGLSARKKFFVKVYAAAHYMDKTGFADYEDARGAALSDMYAKQLTLDFARGVDAESIQNAFREGFDKNSSVSEQAEISALVDQFVGYFGADVEEDDQFVLRWLPGGIVLTSVGGEDKPPLTSVAFAKVLWRIWVGNHSVVDKNKLFKMSLSE